MVDDPEPGYGSEPSSGVEFGKFRVVRKLGTGGFGAVYEALLPGPMGFTKRVAIKKIRPVLLEENPRLIESLINEARIGGLLHHANIVDILEFGEVGGQYYLAMEFVDGYTLAEILEACRRQDMLLPRFAVLKMAGPIVQGLHHAHTLSDSSGPLNLVHRDLKPANVIVGPSGVPKIIDFGIAKAASNLSQTATAAPAKGSPRYMSPEQTLGKSGLSGQSDLFSMGAVLFEMITGRPLYDADSLAALAHQIAYESIDDKLDQAEAIMPGCRPVLDRALRKQPGERHPTARALADDLRALEAEYPPQEDLAAVLDRLMPQLEATAGAERVGETPPMPAVVLPPPPPSPTPRPRPRPRPRPPPGASVLLLAVGALVALGLVAGTFPLWRGLVERTPEAAADAPAAAAGDGVVIEDAGPADVEPDGEGVTGEEPPADPGVDEMAPPAGDPVAQSATATPEAAARETAVPPAAAGPSAGTLSLYGRPWVDIYLDGEFIKTDVRLKKYPVSGGRHRVKMVCTSLGNLEKEYVIDVDGQDENLGCWDFGKQAPCGR